ncbi:discoidin domain-containing protein [bacterium]|nr:discoidin domain-containing protein [bacterium]
MKRTSLVLSLILAASTSHGGEATNLALGKPYTMTRPSYRLCTDPGDKTQLTDGVYTKGYFWTQKTTVGWGRGAPAFVTIDLGKVHAIGGASFSTAAGVAGVEWPTALLVFVSDDGKQWWPAGDLAELSETGAPPPIGKFANHTFRTGKLPARGRYVQLACLPTGPYLFVDEIEVTEGDAALLQQERPGKPTLSVPQLMDTLQLARLVKSQLRRDLAAVRDDIAQVPAAQRSTLATRADALARRIAAMPPIEPAGFRAVLPMTDLERDIFRLQAAVWRAQGKPPLRVWKSHRWDPLAPADEPAEDAPPPALTVDMMSHEWRADTLNITNASDGDRQVRLWVEGLPTQTNPPCVAVHEVQHVGTRHFTSVAAALPLARRNGDAWVVSVPSGMTRQAWISIHPTTVAAGTHTGRVLVRDGTAQPALVPFRLRVHPLKFPDRTTLQLGGWSYTNAERMYGVTPQNRDALIKMLREHHVNTPWATKQALPNGTYDAQGSLVEKPDTANFDAWADRWPGATRYLVFVAVGDYNSVRSTFEGSQVGTPLFATKVGNWTRFWASHLRQRGLKPSQLGLLLIDEPNRKEQYDVTTAWAKAIKAAEPDVVIWVDAVPQELETCREMLGAVDMLVPNRAAWLQKSAAYHKLFLDTRQQGKALGFYSCSGPARRFDPYAYYLLQQWHVFAIGGQWAGFWAFADNGNVSCWNEYVAKGNDPYCPLYIDSTSVTTAKYLEAIREGVQDYETLTMLRDRIAALERTAPVHPRLADAKKLLATACDRVLKAKDATEFSWDAAKDRTVADRVRIELLEMLVSLQPK